jgi:ferritin-like metal-binding protein YciE
VPRSFGHDTPTLKTMVGQAAEFAKGFGTIFARDERVKDTLVAYANEHFEIACYNALRAAADLIANRKSL